ncbi:MAG: addiction module protein [Acidobacteriota bacterium]|nr:addiction module protein [Acidobacteriota bacterium]
MSRTFEEVRGYALQLTDDERGQLVDELLDSIRSDEDRRLDLAYAAEIEKRIAEIDSGTAELVDADEAIASARRALDDARQTSR